MVSPGLPDQGERGGGEGLQVCSLQRRSETRSANPGTHARGALCSRQPPETPANNFLANSEVFRSVEAETIPAESHERFRGWEINESNIRHRHRDRMGLVQIV